MALAAALLLPVPGAAAKRPLRVRVIDKSGSRVLRTARLRVAVSGGHGRRVRLTARIGGRGRGGARLARPRNVRLGRTGRKRVALKLLKPARKRLRAAVARCRRASVTVGARSGKRRTKARRRLSRGSGCHRIGTPFTP